MSEQLSDAAALLFGATDEEGESPEQDQPSAEMPPLEDDPQEPEKAPPEATEELDLSKLLEKAELDSKDFYKLKVPGTEQTFGEAKDALQSIGDLALQKAQQESSLRDRENGILSKAREASELYQLLPSEFKTPEVTAQFERFKTQQIQRENQLTLAAIPEWRDPLKATSDREAIAGLMQSYGYSDAEIGIMYGSRELKAWRDYAQLKQLVDGIPDKEVKRTSKNPASKPRPKAGKPIEGATEGGAILLNALKKGK
jgi:hypothetical protein